MDTELLTVMIGLLIWFIFIGIISAAPIVFIVYLVVKKRKEDLQRQDEIFDKEAALEREKMDIQRKEYELKKVVKCSYCGQNFHKGDITCPKCGASTPLEE